MQKSYAELKKQPGPHIRQINQRHLQECITSMPDDLPDVRCTSHNYLHDNILTYVKDVKINQIIQLLNDGAS